jgi:hypothetical protein
MLSSFFAGRICGFFLLLAASYCAMAQEEMKSAFVTVAVSDTAGGAIPNARVQILGRSPTNEKELITGETGNATVELKPGTFDLTVTSPWFRASVMRDVKVKSGEHKRINVVLEVSVSDCCIDFVDRIERIEPESAKFGDLQEPTAPKTAIRKLSPQTQIIPEDVWGTWVVSREIPTRTISCWGEADAKKLLGTEIEYSGGLFRWKDVVTTQPVAETTMISADQFHDDNSGSGSQITFSQLSIKSKNAMQISIHHSPANLTGATIEIPGDTVLVRNKDTIIFSVCNVYFEAKRIRTKPSPR